MTLYLAVTTCNAEQWQQHGENMAHSFFRYWPSQVGLKLYTEGFDPGYAGYPPLELYDAAPWLEPWKAARTKAQRGKIDGRYNYRFDAVKFAHKVAAIGAAAEDIYCDVLIWIDADTITHSPVTVEWLAGLLPLSATMGWIGREVKYPEASFLMFRLPAARQVIREVVGAYQSGAMFKLAEWHDSFVIWHYVKAAAKRGEVAIHSFSDLSLPKRHPFVNSVLAEKMDHWKGTARKERGKSFPSDLVRPRPEPYWR